MMSCNHYASKTAILQGGFANRNRASQKNQYCTFPIRIQSVVMLNSTHFALANYPLLPAKVELRITSPTAHVRMYKDTNPTHPEARDSRYKDSKVDITQNYSTRKPRMHGVRPA